MGKQRSQESRCCRPAPTVRAASARSSPAARRPPLTTAPPLVHLRPGTGTQLTLAIERYVEQPTLAFPSQMSR